VKIYTRTGDDGTTGLLASSRLGKDHARIEAYGTVDELNAVLGVASSDPGVGAVVDTIRQIQNDLFALGAALADPDPQGRFHDCVSQAMIERLEHTIDRFDADLPALAQFILPGGNAGAAYLHLARTVCRRAERRVVTLSHREGEHVPLRLVVYLNRLSDLLFVMARWVNHAAGVQDTPWCGLRDESAPA
jgi:cob(I)alamin adenosyltransferase